MNSCTLCPRGCGADRESEQHGGCGVGSTARVARAALHFGEEPCISGSNGSGTVFFSGCPLHCKFCQNDSISHGGLGKDVSPERLSDIFRELEQLGAHNINLVSPTQFVPIIIKALERYRPALPIVYNTGGYERLETLRLLHGMVDVYLPDLKYANNALALQLSAVPDYFEHATAAILEMVRQTGPFTLNEQGIATRGTMVRHLVLPGHTKDSVNVINWLATNLPKGTFVSLLFQYTPLREIAGFPELSRRLTQREREKVWTHLLGCGLTDGYVQDAESASAAYIPKFDLTGV